MKKLAALFVLALAAQVHATIIPFDLQGTAGFGLLPGNEPGSITGGTGGEIGGGITFDDVTLQLTVTNIGWGSSQGFTDLTSTATASHIHGPTASDFGAGFTQTSGSIAFTLTRSSNATTGGTFTNAPITFTPSQAFDLLSGKFYINIHTSTNGGGELRGFLVAVPEPGSFAIVAAGLAGMVGLRRLRARLELGS